MPEKDTIIEGLRRGLNNGANVDKYIKKLRTQKRLNSLIKLTYKSELTLLMYFAKEGDLPKVKSLLTGENPADPTIKNNEGLNALALAVIAVGVIGKKILSIIDELLKYQPIEQLKADVPGVGSLVSFALIRDHFDLAEKFLSFHVPELVLPANGIIPLHLAVESNQENLVKSLLTIAPEKQVISTNREPLSF